VEARGVMRTPECRGTYATLIADEALAAEPEEAPSELRGITTRGARVKVTTPAQQYDAVWIGDDRQGVTLVSRSEAAALARILSRFAETGEV